MGPQCFKEAIRLCAGHSSSEGPLCQKLGDRLRGWAPLGSHCGSGLIEDAVLEELQRLEGLSQAANCSRCGCLG